MAQQIEGQYVKGEARIAIVAARFNEFITNHLIEGARSTWRQLGGQTEDLLVVRVPGSFELGVTARNLARSGHYHAVICLGCVIRGETDHYDHVVAQAAEGVRQAGVLSGVPCIFGVLTCETLEQAINRAGAKQGNAGRQAMLAAVEMADVMGKLEDQHSDPPQS